MKKRFIITAIASCTVFMIISAQESNQAVSEKKVYTAVMKIETWTGETFEAALSRRTPDTIYISLLEKGDVKAGGKRIKVLNNGTETGIAVNQIKNYEIKNESNIVYRDDLAKRKKQLKSKKAWKIVGITTLCVVAIPIIAVGSIAGGFSGL